MTMYELYAYRVDSHSKVQHLRRVISIRSSQLVVIALGDSAKYEECHTDLLIAIEKLSVAREEHQRCSQLILTMKDEAA